MPRHAAGVAAVALACLVTAAPVTIARFTSSRDSTAAFTTGTIDPPTGLAASTSGTTVTLTWTPTVSTAATGYDVLRSATSGSGYGLVTSVTPRAAATTADTPGNGTWHYVLQSVYQGWRSGNSNEASASFGPTSTGLRSCTGNAPDTGGDGNGYETNPGNGCAADGSPAVDASSGTTTTVACANAGKDRHRFWGYDFGVSGPISGVSGLTVQVDAGLNNNGGTSLLCVELSWDGGSSWTSARQFTFSGAATVSYTLGGTADTWGHAWTLAELGAGSFRVRLTDVTSQPSKDFRLDAVRVSLAYTP